MGEFILKDLKWDRINPLPPPFEDRKFTGKLHIQGDWMGRAICMMGDNQHQVVDITGPVGHALGIYYGFTFALSKDEWNIAKANEVLEVNPAHGAYYAITQAHKAELEGRIKQGLASVQTAVSDYELIQHDLRKYQEFDNYLKMTESADEKEKLQGELQLRTVFVDQVDRYVGGVQAGGTAGRFSMVFMRDNNIIPTVVDNFMRIRNEKDLQEGGQFAPGKVTEVERRVLETKWTAYQQWLDFFKANVRGRLERLRQLAKAREKSIEEYRKWLEPVIARHRLIEESLAVPGIRRDFTTFHVKTGGTPLSFHSIELWCWKKFPIFEMFPTPGELLARYEEFKDPVWFALDKWSRDNLIWNAEYGLINAHAWITEDWVKARLKEFRDKKWWREEYWYYTFTVIKLDRTNIKYPTGGEDEDGYFTVDNFIVSQNVLFAKLLQLAAKQYETDFYVNELLGLMPEVDGSPPVVYEKKKGKWRIDEGHLKKIKKYRFKVGEDRTEVTWPSQTEFKSEAELKKAWSPKVFKLVKREKPLEISAKIKDVALALGADFVLRRLPGPYERGFYERMTKYFLTPNGYRFGAHIELLKSIGRFGQTL